MNTAATRAAIKRASQQARNGMQQLDQQMVDALIGMYTDGQRGAGHDSLAGGCNRHGTGEPLAGLAAPD